MTGLFPQDIETQAQRIIDAYTRAGLTLVTAESCTGGLIASCLTDIPGSSAVLERGFITYSNDAKIQSIDVNPALIQHYGAVSAQVARSMALGALVHSRADISLSVTGIAGPGGGTSQKPVGLVYLALARRGHNPEVHRFLFDGLNRMEVRLSAVRAGLEILAI